MTRNTRTTSAKAAGSMKDVGRSGGSVSVNRNYGSTKALYSSRAKEKEEEEKEKKNSGSAAGSMKDASRNQRDVYVNRNSGSIKGLYSENPDDREGQSNADNTIDIADFYKDDKALVTSPKSIYNSTWADKPKETLEYTLDDIWPRKPPEERVDVGQLAFGVVDQAYNQFVGDALGTADFLFGTPYQKLMDYGEEKFGWEDRGENFISAYNKQFQENARKEAEYYAQNASKSELASLINQFGPTVLALLPEVALAYLSKGSSLAANGMKAAGKTASIVNKASKLDNVTDVMKNASLWGGTASTIGQTYNQAKYEGADTDEAMKYALTNGMLNFGLNTLGLMHGQAGMETLPGQLRELATPMQYLGAYGKAALHDGGEAVAQGALQRGARAIYDDNVELVSADNPNAVLNPRAAMMDFGGGTAASLVTAGMHAGTKALDKPANAAAARLETYRYSREIAKGNKNLTKEQALEQAMLLKELKNGNVLTAEKIRGLNMKNPKLQEIFTRETGVPFTPLDNLREDTLRKKFQMGAMKVRDKETVSVDNKPLESLGNEVYNIVARNPIDSRIHKHGDWTGKIIHEDRKDFINGKKLKPNVAYVSGENNYIYQTDSAGRIQNATGVLLFRGKNERKDIPDNQTPGKLPGDDASHIFGDQYGGSPGLENLISLGWRINKSDHAKIENRLKKALKNKEDVYVDYEMHYPGNSKRPDWFTVTYYSGSDADSMEPISVIVNNSTSNPPRRTNKSQNKNSKKK